MRQVSLKDCRHAIDIEKSRNRTISFLVDGKPVTLDHTLRRLNDRHWICGTTLIRRRYQVELTRIARFIIADEKATLDRLKQRVREAGRAYKAKRTRRKTDRNAL